MDFFCPEKDCPATGAAPVVRLPDEACMDEQNLAAVFCPHCGQTLHRKKPGAAASTTRIGKG